MKKFFVFLLIFFSFTFPVLAATVLYEEVSSEVISSGVVLNNYRRLIDNGWLNINVLKVDISNKYTNLDLLTSSNGVSSLQNVKSMASNYNSIAAINGDFFAASSGRGNSMGLAFSNGSLISSAYYGNKEKDEFASFVIDEDENVFLDYFSNVITLTSRKSKKSIEVSEINKFPLSIDDVVIYTPKWGEYSYGSSEDRVLTELVVINNKVEKIRLNEPPFQIPENGFVISAGGKNGEFLAQNFDLKSKISIDIEFNIDTDDIDFAVSGGAVLVRKGYVPSSFDSNISGVHPRSAIGISKDEKFVYLVTVDGRQDSSIGMSQYDLAEFLLEIGCYNAINLDGGGSTTMVARRFGDSFLSTINSPSGGTLRSVINAIGVIDSSPKSSKVANLEIVVSDTNVFLGKEREVFVKATNKYFAPIEIDQNDIEWSFDGVPVSVSDGVIVGDTVGMTMLEASYGKVSAEIEINVLSSPSELSISPKMLTAKTGVDYTFSVKAKNKNGYYATLNSSDFVWKVEDFVLNGISSAIPSDVSLSNGVFNALSSGDYIISVSYGDVKSYALITVSGKVSKLVNDFEVVNFVFDEYPDEVGGSAELSSEEVYSGDYSVKLSYDFDREITTRAAYVEFLNGGIDISSNVCDLSFWVYNDSNKDDILKIKIVDSNNSSQLITIQKGLTHTGWKEFSYSLSNISLPAKLTDIYLAQDNINIKSSGYIFIDNLTFIENDSVMNSNTYLPKDLKGIDSVSYSADLSSDNSFRFAIFDEVISPTLMIDYLKGKRVTNFINNNSDLAVFTSQIDNSLLANFTVDIVSNNNYSVFDYMNSTFITVDASNFGIRNSDSYQFVNLKNDIVSSDSDNIFIVMNNSLDNFSDSDEASVFVDLLCNLKRQTLKNIWVIHKGLYTDYSMNRGVKYLGISSDVFSTLDISKNTNVILVTVNGSELSYEIKNVFDT